MRMLACKVELFSPKCISILSASVSRNLAINLFNFFNFFSLFNSGQHISLKEKKDWYRTWHRICYWVMSYYIKVNLVMKNVHPNKSFNSDWFRVQYVKMFYCVTVKLLSFFLKRRCFPLTFSLWSHEQEGLSIWAATLKLDGWEFQTHSFSFPQKKPTT